MDLLDMILVRRAMSTGTGSAIVERIFLVAADEDNFVLGHYRILFVIWWSKESWSKASSSGFQYGRKSTSFVVVVLNV
jgi:hypothetical protein